MTYLQLITKVLSFSIKELPNDDYYEYWNLIKSSDEEWMSTKKLELLYLMLMNTTNGQADYRLLKMIELQLTSYDISLCKTIDTMVDKTRQNIFQDPYLFDSLCLIQDDDVDDKLKEELSGEILSGIIDNFKEVLSDDFQEVLVEKPLDRVIFDTITLLPELFFTEKGIEYVPLEYKIDDKELRDKCYKYVKDSIFAYRNFRIDDYGMAKYGIIDNKCEFDDTVYDEEYGVEEWVIDTQFSGYSGLYYATKLIGTVLKLVRDKEYDKLDKLISIDKYIQQESENMQGEGDWYTLIELLYNARAVSDFDLRNLVFASCVNDGYLDFFLKDSNLTNTLTDEQIGRLILYYFDATDSNSIYEIKNNLNGLRMRRVPRPKEKLFNMTDLLGSPFFSKDDSRDVLLNAEVMESNRVVRTVVYNDNDDSYVPDCIRFDYVVCDCSKNLGLTTIDGWEKLYSLDKPVVFINTSYMFREFEEKSKYFCTNGNMAGAYLWARYFYNNYMERFWLQDKAKFVFIVSGNDAEQMLKYRCGGLTDELRPCYLEKNINSAMYNDGPRLVKHNNVSKVDT